MFCGGFESVIFFLGLGCIYVFILFFCYVSKTLVFDLLVDEEFVLFFFLVFWGLLFFLRVIGLLCVEIFYGY